MSKVRGQNVIVAEYNALVDAYVLYGCARSCQLTLSTETIETSTKGSGTFATFLPTKDSFSGTIDGLVNLDEASQFSLPDIRAKQLAHLPLQIRFQHTAENGAIYTEEGNFYIVNTSDDAPFDGLNSFNVEIKGTGPLTQLFTPTEILANVKRFEYTGSGGELFFTLPLLVGKTVLGFEKDGVGFSKMVGGAPANKEFKFTPATGRIDIAIPFEAGEEAFGYYR